MNLKKMVRYSSTALPTNLCILLEIIFPESSQGSLWGDFKDFNTTSFVSTSTNPRIICKAFKAHAEKSLYRIPPYVLSDRVNISTTMNLDEFRVNQFLSRGNKSEIYSAKISFCPSVVIKKATSEALAEKEILNEIQLLTKMKHQNIITIRGARVANPEPFMGCYITLNMVFS